MIIGIDNGLDGGIVALSPIEGVPPIAKITMPTRLVTYPARKKSKAKTVREICTRGLVFALNSLNPNRDETTVYFEHCPFHADRADTMRSMALSAGKIIAVLEAQNLKTVRILSFDWHPVIIGKIPRGETKRMAIDKARALWPSEIWSATERATTPHTGLVDAALIAEYGRILTFPTQLSICRVAEPEASAVVMGPSEPADLLPICCAGDEAAEETDF